VENKAIKLFLLTGFLGAGKTTLLQSLIKKLEGSRIGVLMNEFGKISVDGVLIRQNGVDIWEINNGSVFCSCLKGAFIDALIACSQMPIDYLFVEASGMADPSNIQPILNNVIGKVKGKKYDYQGAVCIIDALNFMDQIDVLLPIERQIESSNLIVINKVDLIDDTRLRDIEEKIDGINPGAEKVAVNYCDVNADFLSKGLKKVSVIGHEESCNTFANRPAAHVLITSACLDRMLFQDYAQSLVPWLLRMKGFVYLTDGWAQVDVVGSQIKIEPTEISRTTSELAIISDKGLAALEQIYVQWDERFSCKMTIS
jgi:G3E family GTPase